MNLPKYKHKPWDSLYQRYVRFCYEMQQIISKYNSYHYRSPNQKSKGAQYYEEAKKSQTFYKKHQLTLSLYIKAARYGQKVESCVKDFASVLHQASKNQLAILFLKRVEPKYHWDKKKLHKLMQTLQRQADPSIKHDCNRILFKLPRELTNAEQLLKQIFGNYSRVKKYYFKSDLNFQGLPAEQGTYFVCEFDSFSAAKKTLQTFNYEQYFMYDKYWIKQNFVLCEAIDGRDDFAENCTYNPQKAKKIWQNSQQYLKSKKKQLTLQFLNQIVIDDIEDRHHNECKKYLDEDLKDINKGWN